MKGYSKKDYIEAKKELIDDCSVCKIPTLQQVDDIRMLGGKWAENDPDLVWLRIDIKTKHFTKKMSKKNASALYGEVQQSDINGSTAYSTTSLKMFRSYLDSCDRAGKKSKVIKIVCAVAACLVLILGAVGVWYGDTSGLFYGDGTLTFIADGEAISQNVLHYNSNAKVTIPQKAGYDVEGIVDNNSGECMFDGNGVALYKTAKRDLSDYANRNLEVVYTPHVYTASVRNSSGTSLCAFTYTVEDEPEDVIDEHQELEGYIFDGWFTDSKYRKPFSGNFSDYIDEPLVLYPHYSLSGWSIEWALNGGELVAGAIDSYTILTNVTLPDGDIVKKRGYELDGWTLDGKRISYFTPTVMRDVTLSSVWKPIEYSIDYILNGGTQENAISSYTIENEVVFDEPVRKGYAFGGWFDNCACNGDAIVAIDQGTIGDKVVYAKWQAVVYFVEYELDGGMNNAVNPYTYTAENVVTLRDPVKTGYDFLGWFTLGSATNKVTLNATTDGDITLVAQWKAKEYVITAYLNNGQEPKKLTVAYDDSYFLPIATRAGYTFSGYSLSGEPLNMYGIYRFTIDITVFANYISNIYNITYISDGMIVGEQAVAFETQYTLANAPIKRNYEFVGWYDNAYNGNKVTSSVYSMASNMTVYAKWLKTQTINLASNKEYSIDSSIEKAYIIGNYTGSNALMVGININILSRDNNLTINLINVGFKAKENTSAIDCKNSAYMLTVIITGRSHIEGGDGSHGTDGVSGGSMNYISCNGTNGFNGKNAINAGMVVFEANKETDELILKGGSGGSGGYGGVDKDRSRMWLNYTPNGGNGGASASALKCVAYSIYGAKVIFEKGSAGSGGKAGSRGTWWCAACYGTNGKNGVQVDAISYK